jgi:hypothetical protein
VPSEDRAFERFIPLFRSFQSSGFGGSAHAVTSDARARPVPRAHPGDPSPPAAAIFRTIFYVAIQDDTPSFRRIVIIGHQFVNPD